MNPTQTRLPAGWPAWLKQLVTEPNCASGTHLELRRIAYWLTRYHPPGKQPGVAFQWLKAAAQRCDRIPPDAELKRLLGWAGCAQGGESSGYTGRPAAVDTDRLYEIVVAGLTRDELRESSPERCFDTRRRNTARILDAWAAYAGDPDPWVCFGAADCFNTRRLLEMRGWGHSHSQVVPSPMITQYGRTTEGRLSEHSLEGTGPRMCLVVEFDFVAVNAQRRPTAWATLIKACADRGRSILDMNAALIARLSKTAPLWMVVFSGGKSLQAWIPCKGAREQPVAEWFHGEACALGACPSTWGRSQFVRMPDGSRDDGRRQTVEYLDPDLLI